MEKDLDTRIQTLAQWMFEAKYPVVFTGAGISTESGIPDFRGPDGVWTRRDKGLPPHERKGSWSDVDPNEGHKAIVEFQKVGKLKFLISQNIDNLHLKSGIDPEIIAELHGNLTKVRCKRCSTQYDKSDLLEACECGGELRTSVVNFGESLPEKDLRLSFDHSVRSDLFMAIGSSLTVTPAALMPREALSSGAKLVIINQQDTPFDHLASLRFFEGVGDVLPKAAKRLKRLMGFFE